MKRTDPTNLVFPFPLLQTSDGEASASSLIRGESCAHPQMGLSLAQASCLLQREVFLHVGYHLPARLDSISSPPSRQTNHFSCLRPDWRPGGPMLRDDPHRRGRDLCGHHAAAARQGWPWIQIQRASEPALAPDLHQLLQAECDHSSHSVACGHGPHLILLTKNCNKKMKKLLLGK